MLYVITEKDKRRQRNLVLQLWRFGTLSLRFMRLLKLEKTTAMPIRHDGGGRDERLKPLTQ